MTAHPLTILYVDDDDAARRSCSYLLQAEGFQVTEASTGGQALQLARDKPDVVVLDVNLPDIDGFEVCRRIKAHPATTSIPVLHLSAVFISPEDRTHGLDEGADAYLTKPVDPKELIAHVKALVRVHQAEERARAAAAQWQATFKAISDGVSILDLSGTVLQCNQGLSLIAGRPAAALVGRSHLEFTPGRPEESPFTRMLHSRRREVKELCRGDQWLQVVADPIFSDTGALSGAVYILSDITERKRLEAQLLHAQKMEAVGQLAGGIAHDFNNLLTGILGNVGLALSDMAADDRHRGLLQNVEKVGWRAAELVQQLLGFSRRSSLWLKPTNLWQSVDEVISLLGRTFDPRISVEAVRPHDLWPVRADPGQINQVLVNLCLNARDAMPQGGRLVLELKNVVLDEDASRRHLEARPGEFVCLSVSDTGCGIPAEILPRIFEPFFTTKSQGKGTGLGLSMVYGIVRQHQGWVECVSEVGNGARFEIYLPRYHDGVDPANAAAGAARGGKETVLVADDDAQVREVSRIFLENHGYRVLLAEDGQEALDLYKKDPAAIDLLLLDLVMPHLSGRDVLREVRRLNPDARVLLMSGYSEEKALDSKEGVAGFLAKPFRQDDLVRAVRAVLDKPAAP
jgi:two-component system cell cycle sensor histidine kinase/response regulator CckA